MRNFLGGYYGEEKGFSPASPTPRAAASVSGEIMDCSKVVQVRLKRVLRRLFLLWNYRDIKLIYE